MTLPTRRLGALEVSAQGLGCMGMSEFYGPGDDDQSIATIHRALDLGVTLLDTSASTVNSARHASLSERDEAV